MDSKSQPRNPPRKPLARNSAASNSFGQGDAKRPVSAPPLPPKRRNRSDDLSRPLKIQQKSSSKPTSSRALFTRQVIDGKDEKKNVLQRSRSVFVAGSSIPRPSGRIAVYSSIRKTLPDSKSGVSLEDQHRLVSRVQRARFYMLQYTEPNSFLIGGDVADHKYRVVIGPQSCTCGRSWPCSHVLFVMLRVFQLPQNDPRLWSRQLRNFEAEQLFKEFRNWRLFQLTLPQRQQSMDPTTSEHSLSTSEAESSVTDTSELASGDLPKNVEQEETCPICLLEMVDGESVVRCVSGCRNQLHHHCIDVWFDLCRRQRDPLICPLCRTPWKEHVGRSHRHTAAQLSDESGHEPTPLPESAPVAANFANLAAPWIKVYGEHMVRCVFSRKWDARNTGVKHLADTACEKLQHRLTAGHSQIDSSEFHCCVQMVAHLCADPVYIVYVTSLKCLRRVLAVVKCTSESEQLQLQASVKSVLEAILLKCADGNRRASQLSCSAIVEMARGQGGLLRVGPTDQLNLGLGGLDYVLSTVLRTFDSSSVTPQWLLSRMCVLEALMNELGPNLLSPGLSTCADTPHCCDKVFGSTSALYQILTFCVSNLASLHGRIARLSRRVFVGTARLSLQHRAALEHVWRLLDSHDLPVETKRALRRRLEHAAAEEGHVHELLSQDAPERQVLTTEPVLEEEASQPSSLNSSGASILQRLCSSSSEVSPTSSPLPRVEEESPSTPVNRSPNGKAKQTFCTCDCHNNNLERSSEPATSPTQRSLTSPPPANSQVVRRPIRLTSGIPRLQHVDNPSSKPSTPEPRMRLDSDRPNDQRPALDLPRTPKLGHLAKDASEDTPDSLSPQQNAVTFLTEVATDTPKGTKKSRKLKKEESEDGEVCICKEEVEEEEAIALAKALAKSDGQASLPFVPGLMRQGQLSVVLEHDDPDATPTPDHPDGGQLQESLAGQPRYIEGEHWERGPLLGTGAFSTCYQAWDLRTGTLMAVKQISCCRNSSDEQAKVEDAVRTEIDLLLRVNNPNVLRLMGATRVGSSYLMFTEWMPGGSVSTVLKCYGPFADGVISSLTLQLLLGLTHLHEQRIIHRDLKGSNLLLDGSGRRLRIADLGTSARLASGETCDGEFVGQLLGTVAFMAPEVCRGEHYGRSCDIWSVGCVIIEMVTTHPPWQQPHLSNNLALIFKIASCGEHPPLPSNASPPVRDMMLRCLEPDPTQRPQAKDLLKHPLFIHYTPPASHQHPIPMSSI